MSLPDVLGSVETALVWQEFRLPVNDRAEYPGKTPAWYDEIEWPADAVHLDHARKCLESARAESNPNPPNRRCVLRTVVERVVLS